MYHLWNILQVKVFSNNVTFIAFSVSFINWSCYFVLIDCLLICLLFELTFVFEAQQLLEFNIGPRVDTWYQQNNLTQLIVSVTNVTIITIKSSTQQDTLPERRHDPLLIHTNIQIASQIWRHSEIETDKRNWAFTAKIYRFYTWMRIESWDL